MIRTANRKFRHNRGLGAGLPDVLNSLVGAAGGASDGVKIVIRSNVTPEITIDVAQLLKPGTPPASSVSGENAAMLSLIKPEVVVKGLGLEKVMAPYGNPRAGMFTVIATGGLIAAALGGLVAWRICRG